MDAALYFAQLRKIASAQAPAPAPMLVQPAPVRLTLVGVSARTEAPWWRAPQRQARLGGRQAK